MGSDVFLGWRERTTWLWKEAPLHSVSRTRGILGERDCFVTKCEWQEVGFVGAIDFVLVLLFIGRKAACLWFELLAARKDGKGHWLEQRRDSGELLRTVRHCASVHDCDLCRQATIRVKCVEFNPKESHLLSQSKAPIRT